MNTAHDDVRLRLLSVADYLRMGEAGVFADGERVELIDGAIYDMPPIGQPHMTIVNRLNKRFVLACGERAIVQVQNAITLGDRSRPEPDVSLLRYRDDFYEAAEQRAEDVLLVVEVAESSLRYDRDVKLGLYARHGIPEAWIVDVAGRRLFRYREPGPDGYGEERTFAASGALEPRALPSVAIDLDGAF